MPIPQRFPPGVPPGASLVLGGARSGKSRFAETLVASGPEPVYLATGRAWDAEMEARIAEHRGRRGPRWTTVEEPLDLAGALARLAAPGRAVLVDCLTLWITNLMVEGRAVPAACDELVAAVPALRGPVVFVSNEVGLGIVPENAMAREFRDHAGRLHQELAARCGHVWLVAAGLPLTLKETPS
ncbi:bifunctional adenosylcobinamide kinase/adenosylcobinamide-phosphate guanylyltransferase [Arenibaculum pallidiluteum]|uniref:bifunctional adenosylcobinamide kinase/adenosylcobinamide-phosphate guanylyltransferase n=1 Tax=Arenibaculum pallidiluteum TaxID=2812559 RepID=UPI001A971E0D|nr:bifunctional adenosylcobinamide kinase/adenosylcobinamide-phosphate guanylyltransferase [Arenibaculum pallidiluteum]